MAPTLIASCAPNPTTIAPSQLRVSKALRSKPITQREINDLTQLPALGQLDRANQSSSQKKASTFSGLRQAPLSPGRSYAAATKCGVCIIGPCTCKAKLKRFQRTASILNKVREAPCSYRVITA